ncbi:MAG: hypothetical protein ABFD91_06405 [Anaerohalosphaeraceae bacterium]
MRVSKQNNRFRDGSALILVVVVTTLLAVVGVMFVMVTRIRDITSSNVADSRNLDNAVQAVVSRINKNLTEDLLGSASSAQLLSGTSGNEAYDHPIADSWMAGLEPVLEDTRDASNQNDDWYRWEYVTDLTGSLSAPGAKLWNQVVRDGSNTITEYQNASSVSVGGQADADGDGVADSLWITLPDMTTARGEAIYAAVRIIDNCAMLNLNTAYCFYQNPYSDNPASPFQKPWYIRKGIPLGLSNWADGGRYLTEINYLPFLRGSDLNSSRDQTETSGWYNIFMAKNFGLFSGGSLTSQLSLPQVQDLLETIENAGASFRLFDIGDELELRNRFILTSRTEARFERKDIANYTFDAGGAEYAALEIPRDNSIDSDSIPNLAKWKWRIDYKNFNLWEADGTMKTSPADYYNNSYKYDRRHLCTVYSFDRNVRKGQYILLDMALNMVSSVNRSKVEEYFRPLNNRPINLRKINITSNTRAAKINVLRLLFTFRDYYFSGYAAEGQDPTTARQMAARKAAQITANMLDYLDDTSNGTTGPLGGSNYGSQRNVNPTFLTKAIIDQLIDDVDVSNYITNMTAFDFGLDTSDIIYGYEMQPFIAEVCTNRDSSGVLGFAIELVNPYQTSIALEGWRIKIGSQEYSLNNSYVILAAASELAPARLTIYSGAFPVTMSIGDPKIFYSAIPMAGGTVLNNPSAIISLQRPNPASASQYITVDEVTNEQREYLAQELGLRSTKRQDTAWKFTNKAGYVNNTSPTLGSSNTGVTISRYGYQLPVANDNRIIDRLADFQRISFISSTAIQPDPNSITEVVSLAKSEAEIRFDPVGDAGLLGYICTINREDGALPGRININTAPQYVIAAAIPPNLVMTSGDPAWWINSVTLAEQIVHGRPYTKLSDLVDGGIKPSVANAMQKYFGSGSINVGDLGIENDFEERHWIFNRLANIFTVRSDTFTAYILVRLGTDGPQRRMIAIFDRSNVWQKGDVPRLVALHPVPDPR